MRCWCRTERCAAGGRTERCADGGHTERCAAGVIPRGALHEVSQITGLEQLPFPGPPLTMFRLEVGLGGFLDGQAANFEDLADFAGKAGLAIDHLVYHFG